MSTDAVPVLAIGLVLDHYRVEEKIGAGGMGEVYRAVDDRLGRPVAIKVLKSSLARDPDRIRRFEQEARAAAQLNHPNIVAIYDVGLHAGAPYIVSELLEGKTLRDRIRFGTLTRNQILDFSLQITQGLVAAHGRQIVHRDLKPENLFLTRDGRVKILDFGIAKLLQPEAGPGHSVDTMTTQTRSGSILGTVAYMSPEQLRCKPVDHRSDIFSFGSILYEMLCGKRAFSGETEVDTMTAVLKDVPRELNDPQQGLPAAFEPIVRHCLEKEPENRFQSAKDLAFALSTISDHTGGVSLRAISGKRMRRKWLAGWLAAAMLVLAVIAMASFGSFKKPDTPRYQRLTFERGTVYSGRFSPDGRTVIYGASWNGDPIQLYSTIPDSHLARSLGLISANLFSVSSSNELALEVNGKHGSRLDFVNGTLARSPMVGGTPREVLENVTDADWSPNGDLAVVHHDGGQDNLEYPIGKVLYHTNGSISDLRFSPSGNWIAFMDHPARWDDSGSICVIDPSGKRKTLSTGWGSEDGLAWSPHDEVWFTAVENGSTNRSLWAATLSGKVRKVLSIPGGFTLQDIARDGRVLVAFYETERLAMASTGRTGSPERNLSWYDWTVARDLSADGKSVLFEATSEALGRGTAIGIRNLDGSPPVHLGDGSVESLSPDGKWAVSVVDGSPNTVRLLPVGPGQPREIPLPSIEHVSDGAHFLPDGKHLVINGNQAGRPGRSFLMDLSTGELHPVTPEGIHAALPSPDGKFLAGADSEHIAIFPLAGGDPIRVPGVTSGLDSTQWSADSKAIYVYRAGETPLQVQRLDIRTGALTPVRLLIPQDKTGVVSIFPVLGARDGSVFVYSYYQVLSALDVVSGLN